MKLNISKIAILLAAAVFAILCATGPLKAASGDLDTTFGNGGKVIAPIYLIPFRTRIQLDGKIVTLGSYIYAESSFISRHNADGTIDTAFGVNGYVMLDYFPDAEILYDFVIQSDGKLLAGGGKGSDLALFRYNSDGTRDTSFGINGAVSTHVNNSDYSEGLGIALQADSKITATGYANIPGEGNHLVIARYNPNGTLDTTFGTNGLTVGSGSSRGREVLVQPDGKLIVSEKGYPISNPSFIARYNSNGTPDNNFGKSGRVNTGPQYNSGLVYCGKMALQTDGKIVVNFKVNDSLSAIKRYNPNGTPDISFGSNGVVSIPEVDPPSNFSGGIALSLAIQQNGKILTAGDRGRTFAISRYNSNGTLDTTFGTNGVVVTPFQNYPDNKILNLALQPDGKIVASGLIQSGNIRVALARYLGELANVTNIEELYTVVNDPQNAGSQIVIAPGVYLLSVNDAANMPRPNGGRLELQENMSLRGFVGDRNAVVIEAINLPASSYNGEIANTGAIRMGRGTNSIEWLTITDAMQGGGGIIAHLSGQGTTHIRVAHVASLGNRRGIEIRNAGAASAAHFIDADIVDNDLANSEAEGIRIVNPQDTSGGVITARLSNNRSNGNRNGMLLLNSNSSFGTISVTSLNDRFYENAAGTIILCGLSSGSTADGNTVNFTAKETSFENNNGSSGFDLGGLVIVGGENKSFPDGTSNNTVNVSLSACVMRNNQLADLNAIGARSDPKSIGAPGTNNHVTLDISNAGTNRMKQTFRNSIPDLPGLMNRVVVFNH